MKQMNGTEVKRKWPRVDIITTSTKTNTIPTKTLKETIENTGVGQSQANGIRRVFGVITVEKARKMGTKKRYDNPK